MQLLRAALIAVLLAPTLFAQEADLHVTSVTVDKSTLATGEPLSFTARVRNNGPAAATDVVVRVHQQGVLTLVAPPGWTCRRYVSD